MQSPVFQIELADNQNVTSRELHYVVRSSEPQARQTRTRCTMSGTPLTVCGDNIVGGALTAPDSDCQMYRDGHKIEARGGLNRVAVYASRAAPTVQTTDLPGRWQYSRCLAEPAPNHVFPYHIYLTDNNSAQNCLSHCSAFGYPAAGMEFGHECCMWPTVPWRSVSPPLTEARTSSRVRRRRGYHLTMVEQLPLRVTARWRALVILSTFAEMLGGCSSTFGTGTLNNWGAPANIGRYEYLVPGLVPPLLATVGINGKVFFLEKFSSSEFQNSTGAYELDLSLVNDFSHAWREMHVKSDVFCSGAVVLPDKAGRILNVGGYSQDSTFGLRLYAPDGSAGVNGTNDWEEDPVNFILQSGRWYPTALVLSNGSVLVMGGENGPNGPPVPTLEILPRIPGGDTQVFLDWLNRTDPNNLYPFLHVLPSGLVFAGYYNEARLLDPVTFATVEILPNIPGSVGNSLAGRNYPFEGASVLLPQRAPYTDETTVLICGGSDSGGDALDNCVSIQPEATNPTWVIERMPSKRVMPCMVALPDGTFMIMNGAQKGVAGFDAADDPNLSALLYDPSQPAGARISILNNTTIARMYHSEATLLPDGRVLVSGSDPNPYDAPETRKFPEELRIEVYIPPYLNEGLRQPVVTIPNTDWAYGGQYRIHVQLFHGKTSGMRVSLIAATSSTHGNTMGGRTIFPAFSCSGNNVCTVTAPPNSKVSPPGWHQLFVLDGTTPSHGVFVRIGGDPALLGNWPALPGFNPPGV
ncbi:copper radical oxidase [Lactarius akahatsu]|uniref:Copper radical oxidase n=1 Tax=Lactarius akahatsu TaxID=416441 RepID=A0AAD4LH91_9AGAM|nr:copper radical oxidase [Lactarius akahatsu]